MQSATRLAYAGDETERSGLRRDAASARALLDELERSVGTSPLERDVSAQAGEELMRLGRAMIARAEPFGYFVNGNNVSLDRNVHGGCDFYGDWRQCQTRSRPSP